MQVACAKVSHFARLTIEEDDRLAMPLTQFDFEVEQHPSFCLVTPFSDKASDWLSESTDAEISMGGVPVEWRYIETLCHGILDAGLQITKDGMRMLRSDGGDLVLVE